MLDGRKGEASPIATVEEIQRRLIRPSRSSPTPTSTIRFRDSSHSKASLKKIRSTEQLKMKDTKEKKLEDYLDPVLLSAVCSKIKDETGEENVNLRDFKAFDWPAEDLKPFMEYSRAKRRREWRDEAVNLNDDLDGENGEEKEEEDDGFCSPFRLFEKTVSKLFQE